MGPVSNNKKRDPNTLEMFELPPEQEGVVHFPTSFKRSDRDGYPVWSENKAKLIQRYVRYFVFITKHGTYLDGFAGPQVESYNDDSWSAKLVLEIKPAWLRRFILCDLSATQIDHLNRLKGERLLAGDKRKIEIHGGDFNQVIDQILVPGSISDKEATFCLLDQRTFQCKWQTVRKIANHKSAETKIELFYFLPVGWLARSIAALKDDQQLIDWWGMTDVEVLRSTTKSQEFAKLFMVRFEQELGYKSVLAWPIYGRADGGKIMYYMIHATDHPEAPKLMNRAYKNATLALEPMDHLQIQFEAAGFDIPIDSGDLC